MSADVTTYRQPYPKADSVAAADQKCCRATAVWLCTREDGHPGDHQATTVSGRMLASWPQESAS